MNLESANISGALLTVYVLIALALFVLILTRRFQSAGD